MSPVWTPGRSGAPGEIRTPDPLLRRQTLYPTELRAPDFILTNSCFDNHLDAPLKLFGLHGIERREVCAQTATTAGFYLLAYFLPPSLSGNCFDLIAVTGRVILRFFALRYSKWYYRTSQFVL
jgi:hypothetical protein